MARTNQKVFVIDDDQGVREAIKILMRSIGIDDLRQLFHLLGRPARIGWQNADEVCIGRGHRRRAALVEDDQVEGTTIGLLQIIVRVQ